MSTRAETLLKAALKRAGWRALAAPAGADAGADFIAESGKHRFAVQIKSATETRRPLLEGLLASAMLRSRAEAKAVDAKPLAVVFAPSISDAVLRDLAEFASRYGEGIAWGAMDDSGLIVLHGGGLDSVRGERRHVGRQSKATRVDQFSDLGQWMLKVLFNHQLPPELRIAIGGKRVDEPIRNASALSKTANVSVATAARFVVALKEEGFLVEDDRFLRPLRVEQLLQRWQAIFKRRPLEVRARWLFPPKDQQRQLEALVKTAEKSGTHACLGLFAACDRLGLHLVSGVAPHLYVERVSNDDVRQLGLRETQPGESADVLVRVARYPEAIFRAALRRDGVPVTDVLQCWLDVAENPARGAEMAEHLHDRVIRPFLIEGSP